ncbi:hypothetical protein [Kitasatospora viridis]|uniref:Uncharacterized protein n=1 Tax=Kitasatospora viridis TaxID=281105 RepID=A0A561TVG9_9ACTN|nr:hypothetical protein [Kitasatospora viridis]TWF91095.1 hypothetical protein FHX73_12207 [Kitasatospora viridis]
MSVFARLARVAPLAPLAGVVSILSVLALGAPPGMVRQRRRGARMLRRYAGRCGAYRGQVVERRTGAGVVGSDPCWETVTGLWQGDIAEVAAEVARAVRDAGYDWDSGVRAGSKRRWQGTPTRPALDVSLVAAGGALARAGHLAVPRRAGRGPVLVWWHSGAPDLPGRARYGEGKRLRYRRLLPPVVPAGSTAVLMHLRECRPGLTA